MSGDRLTTFLERRGEGDPPPDTDPQDTTTDTTTPPEDVQKQDHQKAADMYDAFARMLGGDTGAETPDAPVSVIEALKALDVSTPEGWHQLAKVKAIVDFQLIHSDAVKPEVKQASFAVTFGILETALGKALTLQTENVDTLVQKAVVTTAEALEKDLTATGEKLDTVVKATQDGFGKVDESIQTIQKRLDALEKIEGQTQVIPGGDTDAEDGDGKGLFFGVFSGGLNRS